MKCCYHWGATQQLFELSSKETPRGQESVVVVSPREALLLRASQRCHAMLGNALAPAREDCSSTHHPKHPLSQRVAPLLPPGCVSVGSHGASTCGSLSPACLRMCVFLGSCSYMDWQPRRDLSDLLQNGDHKAYLNDLPFKLQHKKGKIKSHEDTL